MRVLGENRELYHCSGPLLGVRFREEHARLFDLEEDNLDHEANCVANEVCPERIRDLAASVSGTGLGRAARIRAEARGIPVYAVRCVGGGE